MGALKRTLKVELQRSVGSTTFLLSIGAMIVWLLLGSSFYFINDGIYYFRKTTSVVEVLNKATTDFAGFANLILAIAAITYAWSYCQDKDSGYLRQAEQRAGICNYTISKVIATALSAFLAAVAALAIFHAFLCTQFQGKLDRMEYKGIGYVGLAYQGKTEFYYFIRYTLTGLTCSLGAVFGLCVTAYIPNVYMAFLTPLITYDFSQIMAYILHLSAGWLNLDAIMFYWVVDDVWLSFLIAAGELLLMIGSCGWLFCRKVRKEQDE